MSDAAYKVQPDESSGLALRGLVTLLMEDDMEGPCSKSGIVHLVDFLTRRIRRVVRSTFSAELNAPLDSLENVLLVQLALHEIFCGVSDDVEDLVKRLENGWLYPPVEVWSTRCPSTRPSPLRTAARRKRAVSGYISSVSGIASLAESFGRFIGSTPATWSQTR